MALRLQDRLARLERLVEEKLGCRRCKNWAVIVVVDQPTAPVPGELCRGCGRTPLVVGSQLLAPGGTVVVSDAGVGG